MVMEAVGDALVGELTVDEGEGAAAPAPLVVHVGVIDAVTVLDNDTLGVLLAEIPTLCEAAGEAAKVALAEGVAEGVRLAVPLPLGGDEWVGGGVALPVNEMVPELEGLMPMVRGAVGEAVTVVLGERVEEGVGAGVAVVVDAGAVALPVAEALAEALAVQAPLGEMAALADSVKTGSSVKSAEGEPVKVKAGPEEALAVCVWVATAG
jgi:hypothetical protein